jgi:glycerol-3-phosphate dehydrogenase (NAD(P)+)
VGARPELAEAVRDRHENDDYLPGHRPAAQPERHVRRRARPWTGADFVVLAVPVAEPAREPRRRRARAGRAAVLVSLMKGVELGTPSA